MHAVSAPGLVRDGIYTRVRAEILSCALQPGAQIREQELAQRYRVSKSPIRDALLRLQEQNLVEVLPRKGYRVRPISVADAIEMYEMRLLYERACVLRAIETASDAELAGLDAFRNVDRSIDLPAWIAYNRRFHTTLAGLGGNARLTYATTDIVEQFDRLTRASVTSRPTAGGLQRFVDEHRELIDAIRRRDKRLAATLIREHIESSRKRTLDAIANPAIVP